MSQTCHHSDGGGSSGVSLALTELLRAHAMRRWGEDLDLDARQRLEQGGLPPLDLFLANPSAVARKLASLQVRSCVCTIRAVSGSVRMGRGG